MMMIVMIVFDNDLDLDDDYNDDNGDNLMMMIQSKLYPLLL